MTTRSKVMIGIGVIILLPLLIGAGFVAVNFVTTTTSGTMYDSAGVAGGEIGLSYAEDLGLASTGADNDGMFRAKSANIAEQSAPTAPSGASAGDPGAFKKIIKNGDLRIYIRNAEEAAQNIASLAATAGGYVEQSQINQNASGEKSGTIVIRVPADSFETVMRNAKTLAVEVEREFVSSQDVTEEFVDLSARLRNLRAQEQQYLAILSRSGTIQDTLNVTQYLSQVRGEIERSEGRMKYLSQQVDMSRISVALIADADVSVFGIRWRPLIVAKQSVKALLSGLADYADWVVRFLFKLPLIALWLATVSGLVWLAWKIVYWFYRKVRRGSEASR